ncbi:MAG TPA: DUF885 domain-containing protein [Gemmatimonadales bacterium]|nr:DUF885 domain-containing protein [Gemmatimonadales bacterium]
MSAPEQLVQSYLDLRWHFDPAAATAAGITSQNERLGDYDVESMRVHVAAFRSLALAIEALDVESTETEIDRTAVLNEIRTTIFRFEQEQPHVRNPTFWLSHLYNALYSLMDRQEAPDPVLAAAALARLRMVPAFIASAAATLRDPAPILAETAIQMVEGGGTLIGRIAAFAQERGMPGDEVGEAAGEAEAALARFGWALKTDLPASGDPQSFAIGEDAFNHRLHFEYALQGTAPELWRYGMRLVEEVEAGLVETAREIDPNTSWRDLAARLRSEHPASGDPIVTYQSGMEQARDFVRRHDLVSIPEAPLVVVPTPEFLRPLIPIAAYSPPGPYHQDRSGRFYVTPRSDGGEARASRSIHELPSLVLHEGYPGHHLQMVTAQSLPSMVRRVLWTPLTVEGWALYCEGMMDELGFYQDPAARLFQQVHLLWRAVRILLDVGLHTRGMSPSAALVYLIDKVPLDQAEAAAEIRRYCGAPTYQLCYAVGRREILALRDDYQRRAGSSFTLRKFHDDLLGYGGLPVSLARWGMGLEQ